jgi:hypothetical protein
VRVAPNIWYNVPLGSSPDARAKIVAIRALEKAATPELKADLAECRRHQYAIYEYCHDNLRRAIRRKNVEGTRYWGYESQTYRGLYEQINLRSITE